MTSTAPQLTPVGMRSVLGRIPTGVLVVTTTTPTGPLARTANSFTSLSLSPPLVSICFGDRSLFAASLRATGTWAVSVLAADQQALSRRFANPATASLDGVPHAPGTHTGAALLTEAIACLECHTTAVHPAGDHLLFIGEVLSLHANRVAPPLLFHRGDYHTGPAKL